MKASTSTTAQKDGCYIMLLSVHGLIRGSNLELGRDADTGGQVKYVVELARALIKSPAVRKVDLVTRLIDDPRVDDIYAQEIENLAPNANIVRVRCGPDRYVPKEALWPYMDSFIDNTLQYMKSQGWAPDLVHGHYADAGYVASRLAALLDVPMAFTGHSLGRVKRQRLLDQGMNIEKVERRYRMTRRIEAEETALEHASFVVTSTNQEMEEQYALYDRYQPERMAVIAPGVDLERFLPPSRSWHKASSIAQEVARFLKNPAKPMILALSRPDLRKNIQTLLHAYGQNKHLREAANLVLIVGTRNDIRIMEKGSREVLSEILYLIDYYDLYGNVAYPKYHEPEDVPDLYRIAASSRGVFVNPALTEPFGLTLLESAASGLPIVATQDGGPRDIIDYCLNGQLVDPLDVDAMGEALLKAVTDRSQWKKWSANGIRGVNRHFSWNAHVNKYVRFTKMAISQLLKRRRFYSQKRRLIVGDRAIVTDIDNTLIGDKEALRQLLGMIKSAGDKVIFGVATGRSIELTMSVLQKWNIPIPQLLITSVGSAIHYGPHLAEDKGWQTHISNRWRPDALRQAMAGLPGLNLQPPQGQSPFKISYDVDPAKAPSTEEIVRYLRRARLQANVIYSHQAYLDLLPIRASKGMALRHFAMRWGIPLERCLVAGDSGNDEEMLTGNTIAVVVSNHDPELEKLRDVPDIYFAEAPFSWGIIEGIKHYGFLE